MVATLTRILGVRNLPLVEDVVQEAFCRAVEVWRLSGAPENPSTWLRATAKNCALDALRRERTVRTLAPELARSRQCEWTLAPAIEDLFGPNAISDGLLRMMFSCCHPRLPEASQVALILNVLCGFSVDEIANAFVSSDAAIEKRITRAKRVLAKSRKLFDVAAPAEFQSRLSAVHGALYLLFNEGYHGASQESAVRSELCREAMRLTAMLLDHPLGAIPTTYALAALMCLNAARLPSRVDAAGNLHALFDQDRTRWDQELMDEGLKFLELSAVGSELSEYHIEAAIAAVHASASRADQTDWARIASFYAILMTLRPTPIVALNRAIAIAQSEGPERGLQEIDAISDRDELIMYPFYSAALGEFELRRGSRETARKHFRAALAVARNPMEQRFLGERLSACEASELQS